MVRVGHLDFESSLYFILFNVCSSHIFKDPCSHSEVLYCTKRLMIRGFFAEPKVLQRTVAETLFLRVKSHSHFSGHSRK